MKMPTPDERRAELLAVMGPHVPEPILATGYLQVGGLVSGMVKDYTVSRSIGLFSWAAGRRHRKDKTEERLSTASSWGVAVTESAVYLFPYPLKHGEPFVVSGPPTVWRRNEFTAALGKKGPYTQAIQITFADGHTEGYEYGVAGKGWSDFMNPVRDLLLASGPT